MKSGLSAIGARAPQRPALRLAATLTWLICAGGAVHPVAAQEQACNGPVAICADGPGMPLVSNGRAVPVITAPEDDEGVRLAAQDLAADLRRLGGAEESTQGDPAARLGVIVGTLGRSPLIDSLAEQGRLDLSSLGDGPEAFIQQVVEQPMPGVNRALVIAGRDRRGAIFGAYDLSRRAGVSPWHWWADVPVPRRPDLVVRPGVLTDAPAVRYRGIFLNDEEPALGNWARETFGGINHQFYERVFELVLRLKGNMIWPAMWGKSLWEDDPESAIIADRMGVILGTSHHEPLGRAHVDWERNGEGPWDYTRNSERLGEFWREGIRRNPARAEDRLVTVGMRGDGDEPMTEGTATELLERIVTDQRALIAEETGHPPEETPQVWALYKEVQDYYDAGMQVPDDVTLLFADDNWGNVRRLPEPGAKRPGGYGVYYHFDYVGGPRNYKWLNTTQIARVWEQMRRAWEHGADRLWIVNVGDLKPMELPTTFFLDYAWDPADWPLERLDDYHRWWAAEQFEAAQAEPIADILDRTTRYAARRKPELLTPDSFSQAEWARALAEYSALERDALRVQERLSAEYQDAYYHLVLHPVEAMANLYRLHATVAANRRCAALGDPQANALADQAEALFARDRAIARRYEGTAGGKWPHMMAQTHISYTGWQQPEADLMPVVERIEGAGQAQNTSCGLVAATAPVTATPTTTQDMLFRELDGRVVIDTTSYAESRAGGDARWQKIPQLGRGSGGAMTVFPMTQAPAEPGEGPALDYRFSLDKGGDVVVQLIAAPSLDVTGHGRLRYAVSIDGGAPQVIDLLAGETERSWEQSVVANARVGSSRHQLDAGDHVLTLHMVDSSVVAQRLVISREPIDPLALPLPESPKE